ncbi:OLC1v1019202C1 [Oldenlandia corymbosa var. corymbosa]|uniref:OLC1v1019202C1 n=1 Tax=Oldenlandia corymbosa var. corymbosa TaxID=529605 RepID=A0AAV1EDV9_OLDCO|nr:OLC1v1019202C1 [Oldenlandia corymbosa var. corymbosa]
MQFAASRAIPLGRADPAYSSPILKAATQRESTIRLPKDSLHLSSSRGIPRGQVEPAHSSPIQKAAPNRKATTQNESTTSVPEVVAASPATATAGPEVFGVIDGKFDSGYLITVRIGSEEYRGVLYHAISDPPQQSTEPQSNQNYQGTSVGMTDSTAAATGVGRRKRRKKSEMKKRDPAHPKPNRSGYNFFFAEQHARLKPLYPGRDRDISRMIGDSWNKLTDTERITYQEKAVRDKERYRMEMETYKKRLRTGQVSGAVPIHQEPFHLPSSANMDVDQNHEMGGVTPSNSSENVISSNLNSETNTELSIGQPASDGQAMQLLSLRPDLNLMDSGKTVISEDAPNSSGNNEDHPLKEKNGGSEVFCALNSGQENAFGKNQANKELLEVQKNTEVHGNQDKACSGDASVVQNFTKGL